MFPVKAYYVKTSEQWVIYWIHPEQSYEQALAKSDLCPLLTRMQEMTDILCDLPELVWVGWVEVLLMIQ